MKSTFRLLFAAFAMTLSACAENEASSPTKRIALVFDDGPHPEMAAKLMAILEREAIHVSLAQVATTMQAHPETSLAAQAAGHEIVNHSHDHKHIAQLSEDELRHEVVGAQAAMTEILGQGPRWYWPPYLAISDALRAMVNEAGIELYPAPRLVSSDDWNREVSAEQIFARATTGVRDGTVILFHEWREATMQQFPAIIAELRRQGCSFYTFSALSEALALEPAP